jgi:hypothetical protein
MLVRGLSVAAGSHSTLPLCQRHISDQTFNAAHSLRVTRVKDAAVPGMMTTWRQASPQNHTAVLSLARLQCYRKVSTTFYYLGPCVEQSNKVVAAVCEPVLVYWAGISFKRAAMFDASEGCQLPQTCELHIRCQSHVGSPQPQFSAQCFSPAKRR